MSDVTAQQEQPKEPAAVSDRRTVLLGAAVVAGGLTLAACSSSSDSDGSSGGDGNGSGDDEGSALAQVDDIPEGSALVVRLSSGPVVLVRDGDNVSGLTAVCTHQGCTVNVDGAELPCPCHGSVFALDGSVLRAPATEALAAVAVVVVDGNVSLA